ncbi:Hypothetical predicted protein [Paramuricea clavata]|uniref:Uncharacterized protein n=1 Tax=Paramuricea clavata TaxID=317549 RepID=A0A7D9DNN1_PARCT|nr:Hypothetical predicted protein [Paramuricea clavata]
MPCTTNYMPKGGKTGNAICDSLLSTIKVLQVCEACVKRTVPTEHIIDNSIICKSRCNECLSMKSVCVECAEAGQSSCLPCLRACDHCLGCGILCKRRVFLVATADCEEGNKKAFYIIKESIADQSIDPELSLLSIIPDVPHVGKSLKAGFSNWFLKIGKERSNLAVIRSMRSRSSSNVKKVMTKLIPKNDHVRNRDRQDPSAVLSLTGDSLLNYLSNVGLVSTTIIPETSKFTIDNRPGMYPRPISVAIGSYGWIYVLYNYDEVNGLSDLLKARLHSPVDKVKIVNKQVKATSVHFAEGVVYLCGDNSPITVVDENSVLALDVGKIKTGPVAKQALQTYGLPVRGTVAQMKECLQQYKSRVKDEYAAKRFLSTTINFWRNEFNEQPSFTAICLVDGNLLYAACATESIIASVVTSRDGIGMRGTLQRTFSYDESWRTIHSLRVICSTAKLFVVTNSDIDMLDLESQIGHVHVVDNERDDVIFSDPINRKIYQYTPESEKTEIISGNGDENCIDGPVSQCSYRQPYGIAVEFDYVVYVTDAMSGTVHIISCLENTVKFLQAIGGLYKSFSVHDKGGSFEKHDLRSALELVSKCKDFLEENERVINRDVTSKLPRTLNGPQGNVASKTVDSVRLIEWGLSRLKDIVEQYNYQETNLLSCMTLDTEHFHSTTHFKCEVMTMLQYARSFGNCVKESMKRLSSWSAHYFTNPNSWYPLPEGTIHFRELPKLKPLPAANQSDESCQLLKEFSSIYGRAVRQRSGRQETTMAKSGTLPPTCYQVNLPIQEVTLHRQLDEENELNGIVGPGNQPNIEDAQDVDSSEGEVEYDSDESELEFEGDNDQRNQPLSAEHAADTPELAREAFFLIGSRSRFGRTVRFNGRFVQ